MKSFKKRLGCIALILAAVFSLSVPAVFAGCTPEAQPPVKPPVEPIEPEKPVIPDPTGTEYRFEAEDPLVELKKGMNGGLFHASETGTDETYVAGFNANPGASIKFKVNSEKDTEAFLVVSVCKREAASVFTEVVFTQVNDDFIDSTAIVPATSEGDLQWVTFVDVNLGKVNLKGGDEGNVITFTMLSPEVGVGYNFNRISLYTEDSALTLVDAVEPEPEPVGDAYWFEAEECESNGWNRGFRIDPNVPNAHGNSVVRGIGENADKGFYFKFKFKAEAENPLDRNYTLFLVTGVGGALDVDASMPLTVNGTPVTTDKALSGSWEEYKEYRIADGFLEEENEFVFEVKDGCLINFDAIKVVSKATLTKIEAEPVEVKVTGITAVLDDPEKEYAAGQTLNKSDFIVTAQYDDGTSEKVTDFTISPATLELGNNTVTITYSEKTATLEINAVNKNPVYEYRLEAEKAESNSWNDGTDWLWRSANSAASGGLYVCHIDTAGNEHPGEAWMSYTFTSDRDATAVFSFMIGLGIDYPANSFTVLLDGEDVPTNLTAYSGQGWDNYIKIEFGTLNLTEGEHTIKIIVNAGAGGNIDSFVLSTEAILTGVEKYMVA